MRRSKIFSEGEMDAMDKRIAGDKSDDNGVFAARLKPKVIEIVEVWFPKKRQLRKLLGR